VLTGCKAASARRKKPRISVTLQPRGRDRPRARARWLSTQSFLPSPDISLQPYRKFLLYFRFMSSIPHVDSLLGPRLGSKGQFPSPPDTHNHFLWCQPSCSHQRAPQKTAFRLRIAAKEEASSLTARSWRARRAAPGSAVAPRSPAQHPEQAQRRQGDGRGQRRTSG